MSPTSLSAPLGLSTPARTGQVTVAIAVPDLEPAPPASTGAPKPTGPTPDRANAAPIDSGSLDSTERAERRHRTGDPTNRPQSKRAVSRQRRRANRKAIVEVWVRYWGVYQNINNVAAPARAKLVSTVAVDPVKKELLASAVLFDQKHQKHLRFCIAQSVLGPAGQRRPHGNHGATAWIRPNFGSKDVKTGSKLTEGYTRDNTRGIFA